VKCIQVKHFKAARQQVGRRVGIGGYWPFDEGLNARSNESRVERHFLWQLNVKVESKRWIGVVGQDR
jgi:hypothetical protein